MEQLYGQVERITFQSPESGFTVARLKVSNMRELVPIVGNMITLRAGENVRCSGIWKHSPQHGKQFEVYEHQSDAPTSLKGIQRYLESGFVKGLGPKYAERIVAQFKENSLEIIEHNPEKLLAIKGVGKKLVERIKKSWIEQAAIREIMIFLQSYEISPLYSQKILHHYGEKCIEIVKKNPYILARDIRGIGFKNADKIAQRMSISNDSAIRIEAGIEFVLSELAGEGHTCYPIEQFIEKACIMLEVEGENVRFRLNMLQKEQRINISQLVVQCEKVSFVWLRPYYLAEHGIKNQIDRLLLNPTRLRTIDIDKAITWVQKELSFELAKLQKKAIEFSLSHKMQIITGGPGTGKSTITNAILKITNKITDKIILAAPTGRAAKRMQEITGLKAFTIHALLEFDFKKMGFRRDLNNPLDCDLIIIDEASMIDTSLMYHLLKAIPCHARVIFVGDINQLPSVGPGNVLRDMINSKRLCVSTLSEIFRQASGSQIITNAHRINKGLYPTLYNGSDSDFFFIDRDDPNEILTTIMGLVTSRIPQHYNLHPLDDIQILSPMKKGIIGTENLNSNLQKVLNQQTEGISRAGYRYLIGDKIMQIRNNYNKDIYNGDIGRISAIDLETSQTIVIFDGKEIIYELQELDEIIPAYAVSIHKYQGSECPCIIMPIHTTHFKLLCKNLLYTGVTRGKKLVILVGSKKAVSIAIRNDEVQQRYTGLLNALLSI